MKVNLKRTVARQYQEKLKRKQELEKQYFDALSEDEQTEYLKKKDMESRKARQTLANMMAFADYAGIERYYK
jgi:hypothetical protein